MDEDDTEMVGELIDDLIDTLEIDDSLLAEEDELEHAGPETWEEVLGVIDPNIKEAEQEEEDLWDLIPQRQDLVVVVSWSGTNWLCCTGVVDVDFIISAFKDLLLYILWLLYL